MSTFDGFIREIPNISVDRFESDNLNSEVFFLSHCHADHMVGLYEVSNTSEGLPGFLYASPISVLFLKHQYPSLKNKLVELQIGHTKYIELYNNKKNILDNFYVTALPAGHCPGSVMFLFETNTAKVLYTGDIRLSVCSYKKMNRLHSLEGVPKIFDNIYLDTTFFNTNYKYFPSQFDSFEEIYRISKQWLNLNQNNILLLQLPAKYGSEYIFIELAKRLSMLIHVSIDVFEKYKYLSDIDKSITTDSSKTKIHACEYNKSCDYYYKGESEYKLFIKPSALFWKGLKKNDPFSKRINNHVKVCYSSHASYDELIGFLTYFKPKSITPCVISNNFNFDPLIKQVMNEINNPKTKMNKRSFNDNVHVNISKDIYALKKHLKERSLQDINQDKKLKSLKSNFESHIWNDSC